METIAKLLKAIFFDGDEVNKSTVNEFRKAILWMIVGACIAIGAIIYIAESNEDPAEYDTEVVYEE